jgi:hypothetical protein
MNIITLLCHARSLFVAHAPRNHRYQVNNLEAKIAAREGELRELRSMLTDRDAAVAKLQQRNGKFGIQDFGFLVRFHNKTVGIAFVSGQQRCPLVRGSRPFPSARLEAVS